MLIFNIFIILSLYKILKKFTTIIEVIFYNFFRKSGEIYCWVVSATSPKHYTDFVQVKINIVIHLMCNKPSIIFPYYTVPCRSIPSIKFFFNKPSYFGVFLLIEFFQSLSSAINGVFHHLFILIHVGLFYGRSSFDNFHFCNSVFIC